MEPVRRYLPSGEVTLEEGKESTMAAGKKAAPIRNKAKAVVKPVREPSKALKYWSRPVGNYNPMVVKVVKRRGARLFFNIWDVVTCKEFDDGGKPFEVDLDDGGMVWDALPSTAQLVTPGKGAAFGLLLVTEAWLIDNQVSVTVTGGGKWPQTSSV
jgi:hypothetical protein